MAKSEQKEKPAPAVCVCVCGRAPCVVKHKNGIMVTCTDTMHCSFRSLWAKSDEAAIENWNLIIDAERRRQKGRGRRGKK
jgi:hypothetical protein